MMLMIMYADVGQAHLAVHDLIEYQLWLYNVCISCMEPRRGP